MLPLGCLVHMTPTFESIKHRAARAGRQIAITVATRGLGLQVLRHSPFVDHLIQTADPTRHLISAVRSLRGQLRDRGIGPDCVLTGVPDQRTRIALLGLLSCTAWRGGFTVHPALYHQPLTYDPSRSMVANNLGLATLLGLGPNPQTTQPRIFFSSSDAEAAAVKLRTANPEGRPVVVMVTQSSGGQRTNWHTERFAKVIRHAAHALRFAIVYVGTAAEAPAIEAVRQAGGGLGVSLAGQTTVTQLAALLAQSDFAVALDTGPMHVARAAGLPMVVLGPSWQKPLEWLPLGVENVRILRGEDRDTVPDGYRLDEISAEAVITALGELAEAYPASPVARQGRLCAGLSQVDHLS
jgi:ADP-heptose:LPS heptosyltransferase